MNNGHNKMIVEMIILWNIYKWHIFLMQKSLQGKGCIEQNRNIITNVIDKSELLGASTMADSDNLCLAFGLGSFSLSDLWEAAYFLYIFLICILAKEFYSLS